MNRNNVTRIRPLFGSLRHTTFSQYPTLECFARLRCVCYDPWSYYLVIAAMLGCITIVYPISGITKREWLVKTWLGGWLEDTGAADVSGFAYGWDEAEYPERTMNRARLEMYAWKQFAHGVTVPRFMRDAEREAMGRDDYG